MANLNDKSTWHEFGGGVGFGSADYHFILKETVGIGPNKSWGDLTDSDIQALKDRRNEVIRWINDKGQGGGYEKLASLNKPEASGGPNNLWDEINRTDIGTWHGWEEAPEGTSQADLDTERRGNFGGTDYLHALASGHTKEEVVSWMGANVDKLADPHKPLSRGGSNTGFYTELVGEEASNQYGKPQPDIVEGAGGDLYGAVDYFEQLKMIWETPGSTAEDLHDYRESTLDFLRNAPDSKVNSNNRPLDYNPPGKGDGLWATITTHQRTQERGDQEWYDEQVKISPWWGDRSSPEAVTFAEANFTEADYLASRAGGHSDYDIYRHLRRNKSQYSSEEGKAVYDRIRTGLIEASPMYSEYNSDDWMARLENPLWQEVGEYMSENIKEHDDRDWRNFRDYERIRDYIRETLDASGVDRVGGKDTGPEYFTQAHLDIIVGNVEGTPKGYESGEYWQQWGTEGPPDEAGDGDDDGDLTLIQKMVAQAGLESDQPSDWKDKLEYLENRFLNEMYKDTGEDGDDDGIHYSDAPDAWGLDIMRLDEDGNPLDFDDAHWDDDELQTYSDKADEWYETLTKGNIDWAFYQDSSIYQEAKKVLGLKGTFTAGSLGVAGIREANVWVHGQNTVMPIADDEILKSWKQYEAKPLPAPYTPKDLTITGYTPDDKKALAPVPETTDAPIINIPDVPIARPDNLKPKLGKIVGE